MWDGLLQWSSQTMLSTDPPLANAEDLALPVCVHTVDEAVALVEARRAAWLVTP
jgi:hypothetical protein